jgi:hypothetical protein
MNRLFQWIALGLVLVIGAPALMAAVPCAARSGASSCCAPGCGMMAMTAKAGVQATGWKATTVPSQCCRVSTPDLARFAQATAPLTASEASPQASAQPYLVAPLARRAPSLDPPRIAESAPFHANLCTFLI